MKKYFPSSSFSGSKQFPHFSEAGRPREAGVPIIGGQVKKTLTGIDGSVLAGGPSMEAASYAPYVEFGTSRKSGKGGIG